MSDTSPLKGTILLDMSTATNASTYQIFYPKTSVDQIEGSLVTGIRLGNDVTYKDGEITINAENLGLTPQLNTYATKSTAVHGLSMNGKKIIYSNASGAKLGDIDIAKAVEVTHPDINLVIANSRNASVDIENTSNGATYLNLIRDTEIIDQVNIKGTGPITVTNNENKVININAQNATTNRAGIVKIGNNITVEDGTISLTQSNIKKALNITDDIDIKVKQTLSTNNNEHPLLASATVVNNITTNANNTTTILTRDISINPAKNSLTASTFNGHIFKSPKDNITAEFMGKFIGTADKAIADKNGKDITLTYAPLTSPNLAGIPLTSDPLRKIDTDYNDQQIANIKYVDEAIEKGNTHYQSHLYVTTANGVDNANTDNDNTYIKLIEGDNIYNRAEMLKITGSGATSITGASDGTLIIASTDTTTDENVKQQSIDNLDDEYPILATAQAKAVNDVTTTAIFNKNVIINPKNQSITAKEFIGNASTATQLKSAKTIKIIDNSSTHTGPGIKFDGTTDINIKLPSTIEANIIGNASTATQLIEAKTIDGITFDGTKNVTHYAECSTAAEITEKIISCENFNLVRGAWIAIKFSRGNTAQNATLNINSTGAKNISYRNSTLSSTALTVNGTYLFIYNGINYELAGDIDTDTNNTVDQNLSEVNNEYPILLGNKAKAVNNIGNKTVLFGSGVKINPSTSTILASNLNISNEINTKNLITNDINTQTIIANTISTTNNIATTFTGKLDGNAATATQLKTARTIDGVSFDGNSNINHYAECSSIAEAVDKEIQLDNFTLAKGAWIAVKFNNTNTSIQPKLKINDNNSFPIKYHNKAIEPHYLEKDKTYLFVYANSQFNLIGDLNTDTNNATAQKISNSNKSYPILLGHTANATADIENEAALFGSGVLVNPSTSTILTSNLTASNQISATNIKATTFIGNLNGNASTATQLNQKININISDFEGKNINANKDFDGSKEFTIKLPGTIKATLDGNASTATNAFNDKNGLDITNTYATKENAIHNLTISGRTITYNSATKTLGTITTQDQNVKQSIDDSNNSFPLLASNKNNNDIEEVDFITTEAIINKDVYITPKDKSITANKFIGNLEGLANKATYDDQNNNIANTYVPKNRVITNLSIDSSGHQLTYTMGDNTVSTLTITDIDEDIKVKQTPSEVNDQFPILATGVRQQTIEAVDTTIFSKEIMINPSTAALTASTFAGNIFKSKDASIAEFIGKFTGIADRAIADQDGRNINNVYAPLNSPKLIGEPTAPDFNSDTTSQIATIKHVDNIKNQILGTDPVPSADFNTLGKLANKVITIKQSINNSNSTFPLLASNKNNEEIGEADFVTTEAIINKEVYITPKDKSITAAKFIGNLEGLATKATYDDQNNNIATTYVPKNRVITNLSIDSGGHQLTYTMGDSTVSTLTITDADIDIKVKQTPSDTNDQFPILATGIAQQTTEKDDIAIFSKNIMINPSTATLIASTFIGLSFTGTANKAINDEAGKNIISTYAPLQSPQLIGEPTVPTPTQDINNTRIANTEYVQTAISNMKNEILGSDSLAELQSLKALGDELKTKQKAYAALTSIGELDTVADKMIYTTAKDTYTITSLTSTARNLLDDNDIETMRNTLDIPSTTGMNATGNWNININGNASTATQLNHMVEILFTEGITGSINNINLSESTITIPITSLDASKLTGQIPDNVITSGNASTATKLSEARSINIHDYHKTDNAVYKGPVTKFDGTEDITIYLPNVIKADYFEGLASRATNDNIGNNIISTYTTKSSAVHKLTISGHTVSYKNANDEELGNITLPDGNLVQQKSEASKSYPILATSKENATDDVIGNAIFAQNIKLKPDTSEIIATTFKGSLNGLALKAMNDEHSRNIYTTYATKFSAVHKLTFSDDGTISYKNANDEELGNINILSAIKDENTDINVKQIIKNDSNTYPLLASIQQNATNDITDNAIFAQNVKLKPNTSEIIANTFSGRLNGTADKAIADKNGLDIIDTYATKSSAVHSLSIGTDGIIHYKDVNDNEIGNINILPSINDDNTDINVKQIIKNDSNTYPLLASIQKDATNDITDNAIFAQNVKLKPNTSEIIANVFSGRLNGIADKAIADKNGLDIIDTYETKANAITDLSISGLDITYTKGNGTQTKITIDNTNTDTKMTQLASNANSTHPLLAAAVIDQTQSNGGTAVFNENVYINPSTATLYASTFKGMLDGTANIAIKDKDENNIIDTYMQKVYMNTQVLSASNWNLNNGLYYTTFKDSQIKSNHIVNIIIDQDSQTIASQANMLPINENDNGTVKLFTKTQPAANINITYYTLTIKS